MHTTRLGTRESFEATTGEMLKTFYKNWYAPNNAILVVAGDVEPAGTLSRIRELYGTIERRPLPARPTVSLQPVKPETFTLESNLPYTLAFIAYRMPGTDSADYAAARVLADVLASQRGDLYALVPAGKALETQFELAETYPQAERRVRRGSAAGGDRPVRGRGEHDGASSRSTRGTACRLNWSTRQNGARSHPPSFDATRFPIWPPPGRRPSRQKAAVHQTMTSRRSGASRSQT